MPTSKDTSEPRSHKPDLPDDPQAHPVETVQALQGDDPVAEAAGEDIAPEDTVPGEDVTENPETDEMEDLPGPSQDEPSEPAG